MTAPVDSRLGPGTLLLGTLAIAPQASNVRLVPTHTSTDGTPTLGDPTPVAEVVTTWALQGTAVQDWSDPLGFVEFCRDSNNTVVTFAWVPSTADGVTFSGSCKVQAVEFGGDVAVQTTSDWEFAVVGAITRVDAP